MQRTYAVQQWGRILNCCSAQKGLSLVRGGFEGRRQPLLSVEN